MRKHEKYEGMESGRRHCHGINYINHETNPYTHGHRAAQNHRFQEIDHPQ
jgi:hypothetical protein